MRGTQSSNSSAATWTGGMGPVGGHSSNAKCLGCFCTHFCKTLIAGSTVTLLIESLAATKFCGLLFPRPLLPTQSSPAKPMRSRAPGRCSTWASHFRQSWGTGCREQGCLGKGVCSLEGKMKQSVMILTGSGRPLKYFVHFIPPHLQAWFLGEIWEEFYLYRHFSGLILNRGWCDV